MIACIFFNSAFSSAPKPVIAEPTSEIDSAIAEPKSSDSVEAVRARGSSPICLPGQRLLGSAPAPLFTISSRNSRNCLRSSCSCLPPQAPGSSEPERPPLPCGLRSPQLPRRSAPSLLEPSWHGAPELHVVFDGSPGRSPEDFQAEGLAQALDFSPLWRPGFQPLRRDL
eukprot:CAMPEP_0170617170 /NCGR_PEP_ID=MMETSP0224-20130122/26266_1 /TAXON_ID=285029 /ORGANISM="Togula jolla, Strain CCCM 725" /LENGTH=168 /DNA_ID=CAMNT_0010943027 /DNA_START=223 /DNA_END=729 /DNA_ORIENTATION=-